MANKYEYLDAIWEEYHRTRSVELRNKLVEGYLDLVRRITNQLKKNLSPDADIDELYQCGSITLMSSIERFDPSRGVAPVTYLSARIRGGILDSCRNSDPMPRVARTRKKQMTRTRDQFFMEHGRQPTHDELMDRAGIPRRHRARFADAELTPERAKSLSMLVRAPCGHDVSFGEMLIDEKATDPAEICEQKDMVNFILRSLPPRLSMYMTHHFIEGKLLKTIAEELNLTPSYVSVLMSKSIELAKVAYEQEAA